MDDSCAVCAEALVWVGYGSCGHRDICSTCVARLRFICEDRRCCICKAESDSIFFTKALGNYTRNISDFSALPSEVREGKIGSYWYHEDTHGFFDDFDHYKMIKAMCKLTCSICDKIQENSNDGSKRRGRFRNVEQLKGHLFHRHRLFMCSLCLEGKKVFICEQKLYNRAQLNQHINTGDSEVDGSESERGGFSGHPLCEFCRTPFYGDNELYSHMSTEHYTCHLCQRQHPGQYEYYKNYDDLETHFRCEHFLCEDEACLAKKFMVFQSESEMKRHNMIEHGGRMSRSKRNAALQIPTSFRFQCSVQQNRRRGRGQTFCRDYTDNQRSVSASFDTFNHTDGTFHDLASSSSSIPVTSDDMNSGDNVPIVQPYESQAELDGGDRPFRYRQALSLFSNHPLQESAFPPLAPGQTDNEQKYKHDNGSLPKNTMASLLRRQNNKNATIHNLAREWPGTCRATLSTQPKALMDNWPAPPGYLNSIQSVPTDNLCSLRISGTKIVPSNSDFPSMLKEEDVQTANKSLVERIRESLKYNEEKYTSFRNISAEYRQGSIDSKKYLACVLDFGLAHLLYDLARLLPDTGKQKELVDTYEAILKVPKKGKGKRVETSENRKSKEKLAESVISTVKKLQSLTHDSTEVEAEVLSKDGYRSLSKSLNQNVGGGGKQIKASKNLRARLGDGSVAALLDPKSSESISGPNEINGNRNGTRGVWQYGVTQRLFGGK